MKRICLFLIFTIFSGNIFLGCVEDEIQMNNQSNLKLKNGTIPITPNCAPVKFDLYVERLKKVGELFVSNNDDYLQVEYHVFNNYLFAKVHLWVGSTILQVPKNSKGEPVPNRFSYIASGLDEYIFQIRLSDIISQNSPSICDGKTLYIFAQAEVDNLETQEIENETAWSDGNNFLRGRGTNSKYTTCCKDMTGGGGCSPFTAYGGNSSLNYKWFYYNSNNGGIQNLYVNGRVITGASIGYKNGAFFIILPDTNEASWMLRNDYSPSVFIKGFYEIPQKVPELSDFSYKINSLGPINVEYFPYYIILLDLQRCTTR